MNLNRIFHDILSEFLVNEPSIIQSKIYTISNAITLFGIVMIGFYVYQYTTRSLEWLIPVSVFLIGCSDLFDGFSARQLDRHSQLGGYLDVSRDRLLSGALCLHVYLLKEDMIIPILIWASYDVTLFIQDIWCQYKKKIVPHIHTINKIGQAVIVLCAGTILLQEYWLHALFIFIPVIILLWVVAITAIIHRISSFMIIIR